MLLKLSIKVTRFNAYLLLFFSYLEMMLELEGFATLLTFELPEIRTVGVIGHVALQFRQVGKLFGANGARLETRIGFDVRCKQ